MPHAIQVQQTGGPEVLQWAKVEVGDPGPGQVRLRQEAAGLNFIDVYHRTGLYPQPLPFTPGVEGAGVVAGCRRGCHERLKRATESHMRGRSADTRRSG